MYRKQRIIAEVYFPRAASPSSMVDAIYGLLMRTRIQETVHCEKLIWPEPLLNLKFYKKLRICGIKSLRAFLHLEKTSPVLMSISPVVGRLALWKMNIKK